MIELIPDFPWQVWALIFAAFVGFVVYGCLDEDV